MNKYRIEFDVVTDDDPSEILDNMIEISQMSEYRVDENTVRVCDLSEEDDK